MKKAYMTPLAEVVKTQAETMICASIEVNGVDNPFVENDMEILDNANLGNVFDGLW